MTVLQLIEALERLPLEWQQAEVLVEAGCVGLSPVEDYRERCYMDKDGRRTVLID